MLLYKEELVGKYQTSSANSMLAALNCYLKYMGMGDLCVRTCREQKQLFLDEERELEKDEYLRLLDAAKEQGKERLYSILQTIASTGMRIGELPYLTFEALRTGIVRIDFKGKVRKILLPQPLIIYLRGYCRNQGIRGGCIFITRNGTPVDRRNVWAEMKKLCGAAGVAASKVFPHNLRHLFAKCFYEKEKDLGRLADYLGHSSVETTRRYTRVSCRKLWERNLDLGLFIPVEEKNKRPYMT